MLRRLGSLPLPATTVQVRSAGQKPKKKNKVGAKFIGDSQVWRDAWRKTRERKIAEGMRSYVNMTSTQRKVPYDVRFRPFDRDERDGVYLMMKYMMDDKIHLTHNYAGPVKRLFCNVGLLGPQVTNVARWKPLRASLINSNTATLGQANNALRKGSRFFRE